MFEKNRINIIIIVFIMVVFSALSCSEKTKNSDSSDDTKPPATPSRLVAYATTGTINIYWLRSTDEDVVKYRLYRSTSSIPNATKKTFKPSFGVEGYVEETGMSFADTDITIGTDYYYRVSAIDDNKNESNLSNQAKVTYGDYESPVKPKGLKAQKGTKNGDIDITWTLNTEEDIMSYNIYLSNDGGKKYTYIATSVNNAYTIEKLNTTYEYYVYITAIDTSNNESEASDAVFGEPYGDIEGPAKPVGLKAVTGDNIGEIKLTWNANSESDALSYNIYSASQGGGNFNFSLTTSDTTSIIHNLTPGKGYYFKITSVDTANNESEYSAQVFAIAKGDSIAPSAPLGLAAAAGNAGEITLTWTANSEADVAKYIIEQSSDGTTYKEIDTLYGAPPVTSYTVSGLTSNNYYYFKIKAVDDSGNISELSTRVGLTAP